MACAELWETMAKKGNIPWNKGLTKEQDERVAQYARGISRSMKGRPSWCKGLTKETNESVRRISEKCHKWEMTDAIRARIDQKRSAYWSIPENREKARQRSITQTHNPEYAQRMSLIRKELWRDQEYIRKTRPGNKKTKPEKMYEALLSKHFPGQWIYTGSGENSISIGGKVPDFTHRDQKLLLELFGTYWHTADEVDSRIRHFSQFGYKTLVFWDNEDPDEVLDRISEFTKQPIEATEMMARSFAGVEK
jgi:very-short-patch-repair endonuclease